MKAFKNLLAYIFLCNEICFAQSVTIDPKNTGANIIDAQTTSHGIVIPKMTTALKNAIANVTEGTMVYDLDAKQFSYCLNPITSGTATTNCVWVNFGNVTNAWNQNGNDISYANSGNVGIGTLPSSSSKLEIQTSATYMTAIDAKSTGGFGTGIAGHGRTIGVMGEGITSSNAIGGYFTVNGTGTQKALKAETITGGTAAYFSAPSGNALIIEQGNVGLGTSTPLNKLSVLGNADFSGNLGVGITDSKYAKFIVSSDELPGTTNGFFGYGQAGISLQQNYPTIGFNQYRDISSANTSKYMANGFSAINYLNPSTGEIIWESFPLGTRNDATLASGTRSLTLLPNGNINTNGNLTTNGNIIVNGNINTTNGKFTINNFPISPAAYGHINPSNGLNGSFFGGTYEIKNLNTYDESIILTFNQYFAFTPTLIINRDVDSERAYKNIEYNYGGFSNKIKIKFGQVSDPNFGTIFCTIPCGAFSFVTLNGGIVSDNKLAQFSFVLYGQ